MSQVDDVKAAVDIVKVVGDYVQLRKGGVNLKGLCPFHHEKTPSFSVSPAKQMFYCFGCGKGGDVFEFVKLIENLTFSEALFRLAEKVGITLHGTTSDRSSDPQARERAELYKIHETASQFFAAQLGGTTEGRAARAYLADRGLNDEVIARFRLGYAPANGHALTRRLSETGFSTELLEKSGLVQRAAEGDRRFDRFRRRIIFPIVNESGKLVAFGGRALGDDQPKYLNSPETPIYTKSRVLYHLDRAGSAIRKLDCAVLVEGYMDCIAVASSGIENVVASCGTSLTESQVRLLSRYARRVVVNYDPDSAGVAATERSLNVLLEEGFEIQVLALPDGLDPDAFIRQQGAKAYRDRLEAAPAYLDYLTERARSQHDLRRPEGKIAAANAVLPYLARVPNPMLRAELALRMAERLRLDERLLLQELKRAASEGRREIQLRRETEPLQASPVEKQLLSAFFESEDLANEFLPGLMEDGSCEGLAAERIFQELLETRRHGERLEISRLSEVLSVEERQLLYQSQFSTPNPPDRARVYSCCQALRLRKGQREKQKLLAEIKRATGDGDQARLVGLQKAKLSLDRKMRQMIRS